MTDGRNDTQPKSNIVPFFKAGLVLEILSGNQIMTDEQNDRQPKSNIAPLFQSGACSQDIEQKPNYNGQTE